MRVIILITRVEIMRGKATVGPAIASMIFFSCFIIILPSADNVLAQRDPDASEYAYDHIFATSCIPPGMPVYGAWKDIKGWSTYSYRIEFDSFPNCGGTCTIMARIQEQEGQFHILEDIHWSDYPNWTPPYPDSIHFVLTGSGTTNGQVENRLEWLVQPFCTEPAYFRNCHVYVTYGPQ